MTVATLTALYKQAIAVLLAIQLVIGIGIGYLAATHDPIRKGATMSAFYRDAIERIVWTFIEGFTATVLVAGALDLSVIQAAALAGLMAVLALVKTIAAGQLGSARDTAQLGTVTYLNTGSPSDHGDQRDAA